MAFSAKPAVVVVHGIWHSPITFSKFTSLLQRAGYDTFAPFLPSCTGTRPPQMHAKDDIQVVRRTVEMLADQGRSIIMVLHSYGGLVGSDAVQGLDAKSRSTAGMTGGVVHLVGIAAHFHPQGFSVIDIVHEFGDDHLIPVAFDIANDGTCISGDPKMLLFGELPDDEADGLVLTLSRAPYDVMEFKAQYEAWKYISTTYITTAEDITFPPHYQQRVLEKLEKAGSPLKVVTLQTGHSAYITKTTEVVKVIEDLCHQYRIECLL